VEEEVGMWLVNNERGREWKEMMEERDCNMVGKIWMR
jgi:hypothetical protein